MELEQIIKKEVGIGVNLYIIPTKKFKTVLISYCFHRDLDEDYTYNALVPAVLKRGCEGLETSKEIETYLEDKYGAAFEVGVQKKGERQVLRFTMDVVNEELIQENGLLAQSLYFLNRILTKPVIEDGLFNKDYIEQEKNNLNNRILSIVNDKIQYSMERCIQQMCKDEKYSRFVFGSVDDLNNLDPRRLYRVYEDIIKASPLDIFIVGDIDVEKIPLLVESSLELERKHIKTVPDTIVKKLQVQEKTIEEEMDVMQAKLNMGFRVNTLFTQEEYYPLVIFSSILGGGPHSKLFINVREKASMAYYAFSRLEKFKGIMLIGAGIERDNFKQAVDIILKQIEDIKQGNFSQEEYKAAVNSILTSLNGVKDQPQELVDYYIGNAIGNSAVTIEDFIDKIKNVEPDQVVDVADRIKLDTIYLLSNPRKGHVIHEKKH